MRPRKWLGANSISSRNRRAIGEGWRVTRIRLITHEHGVHHRLGSPVDFPRVFFMASYLRALCVYAVKSSNHRGHRKTLTSLVPGLRPNELVRLPQLGKQSGP